MRFRVDRIDNFALYLKMMAAGCPHQQVVIFPAARQKNGRIAYTHLTYQQLDELSDHVAQRLLECGFFPGMRTAFMVKPSLEFFVLSFALLKAGIVPVLVDPGIGLKNVRTCLAMADAEAFIGIPAAHIARHLFRWKGAGWKALLNIGYRHFPGTISYKSLLAPVENKQPLMNTVQEDTAAILFTSGSTGSPKPVVATHANFVSQLQIMRENLAIQPGEYDLCTYAPFALFAPALGLTTVIPDMNFSKPAEVDPWKIKEAIDDFGIRNMFGSPALMKTVSRCAEANNWQFPSLKRLISAGGPVHSDIIVSFLKSLSPEAEFFTAYGATEAMPVAMAESRQLLGEERLRHASGHGLCVGRLAAGLVKILRVSELPLSSLRNEDILGPYEIGEILVSGPHVTWGYYKMDAANELSKVRDENGTIYHRMGDVGYLDAEGKLWFCGRKSHRVQRSEGDLYSIPVEAVFDTHPLVARTALVGLGQGPDQIPCLCIESKRDLSAEEKTSLVKELKLIASRYKQTQSLDKFLFHPAFPVDIRHNAKIHRESLKLWAEGLLADR